MNLKDFRKVLIIRLSSLGDIILTTPFIRTLKEKFPHLQIDFLIKPQYKDILVNNPYIHNIIYYEQDNILKKQLERKLSEQNYELIIDLQNNFRSASISSKLNAIKVKYDKKNFEKFLLVKFKVNKLKEAAQIPVRYAQTIDDFSLDNGGLNLFTTTKPSKSLSEDEKIYRFLPWFSSFYKNVASRLLYRVRRLIK